MEAMRLEDVQSSQEAKAASASTSLDPLPSIVQPSEPAQQPKSVLIAAPDLTHPGESASNGAAEMAGRSVVEHSRCLKAALEENMGCRSPSTHAILRWLVEHSCYTLYKYKNRLHSHYLAVT